MSKVGIDTLSSVDVGLQTFGRKKLMCRCLCLDHLKKKLKCLWFIGSIDIDTFKVSMSVIDTLSSVDGHLCSAVYLIPQNADLVYFLSLDILKLYYDIIWAA